METNLGIAYFLIIQVTPYIAPFQNFVEMPLSYQIKYIIYYVE